MKTPWVIVALKAIAITLQLLFPRMPRQSAAQDAVLREKLNWFAVESSKGILVWRAKTAHGDFYVFSTGGVDQVESIGGAVYVPGR